MLSVTACSAAENFGWRSKDSDQSAWMFKLMLHIVHRSFLSYLVYMLANW